MVTLTAFADEISESLPEQFAVLQRHAIGHTELRLVGKRNIIELGEQEQLGLRADLRAAGLKVSSLGSWIGKVALDKPFAAHLDAFRRVVDIAHRFATPNIRLFSYYVPKGQDPALSRGEILDRLRRQCEIAAEAKVMLLLENEKELYGDTGARNRDLLETLNHPRLRAIYDPANFVQVGDDGWGAWEQVRDFVTYFHMKDARKGTGEVVLYGRGDAQIEKVLADAARRGYAGFVSLEPHLAVAGSHSGFTGPALFGEAVAKLREILGRAGLVEAGGGAAG